MPNMPRLTPALTPESNRFKRPWSDSSRTPRVPVWTVSPEGDMREGRFRVPLRLCNTKQHSNERLEFTKLTTDMLSRWTEWLRQRGWTLTTKPIVKGPFDIPTSPDAAKHFDRAKEVLGNPASLNPVTQFEDNGEFKEYRVFARFKRETPLYLRLEDALFQRDLNNIYKDEVDEDSGWVDPLVYAEQRRQRLGLKREDYLMGKLSDPL